MTTKQLTSRAAIERALDELVKDGAETFTTADVQAAGERIAPGVVKSGYAAYWLAVFVKAGERVERVSRGVYRPASAPAEDWAARTKKELLKIADEQGVEVARSATKAKIAELLGGAL